jgi:hypothetical protein
LVVPEITKGHAEDPAMLASYYRFTIPAIWSAAGCFAGATTWAAPFYAAIPRVFLCFGVTVIACRADLGAADPRIVSVIAPLDPSDLAHFRWSLSWSVPVGYMVSMTRSVATPEPRYQL